ncbi:MAG TPA: NAD-dependent deacylase [Anaerolineaceae bacterium]
MRFSPGIEQAVGEAASLLRHSRSAVVLTGAGFSTASGIPDFRSPATGLWAQSNPLEVASLTTFHNRPERFFEWFRPLTRSIWEAQPNAAHSALAELEKWGLIKAVITQNIDGLHQRAGSKNVLEVHGGIRSLSCSRCGRQRPSEPFIPAYIGSGEIPHCPECQAVLKPDIVFFEEMLPAATWERAVAYCQGADVLLVAGSSLEVSPASYLPHYALEAGAALIMINRTETHVDSRASVILRADLVEVIPAIAALVC